MEKKIVSRLFGGLGNQLFIYSAMRRLSLKNNASLILDTKTGFEGDRVYKRTYDLGNFDVKFRHASWIDRLEPLSKVRRKFKKYVNTQIEYSKRDFISQEGMDFDSRLLTIQTPRKLWVEGYWQSEDYFKDIESIIRADLKITPPKDPLNSHLSRQIKSCRSVSIHIRKFGNSGSHNADPSYYSRAISFIESKYPQSKYFVFSDNHEYAMAIMSLLNVEYQIVDTNRDSSMAYADMWLMTLCQNHIIANSTFSWWGAWLSSFEGKTVVSPMMIIEEGVTKWGFKGLIPKEWFIL